MTDVPLKLNDLQLPAATVLVKGLSRPLQGEKVRIWQVPAGAVSSALMRDLDLLIIPKNIYIYIYIYLEQAALHQPTTKNTLLLLLRELEDSIVITI